MTVSHWRRGGGTSLVECDVCVVGAGIAGISAALHLQRRGVRVEIVERHHLASGASSRNAGFLMRGAADNYLVACRQWGRERARLVWRLTEENVEGLRAEGIESLPTYKRVASVLLGMEEVEAEELRQSVTLLREDGMEAAWLERGAAGWTDRIGTLGAAIGGLVNPGDGACSPWDLIRFLASKLKTPVREGQEVHGIVESNGRLEVRTGDLAVRCGRVLVCTNAYAGLMLPSLAGLVLPRRGQMLAIRQEGLRLDHSYYANRGFEYFRQHTDGVVVVGGCRRAHAEAEVGYADTTTEAVQRDLERFARRTLGLDQLHVVARWSGVMGFTRDGLPLVGPVAGDWARGSVWFFGGCTGHGMSLFHRTARVAVEAMMDGASQPFDIDRPEAREGGAA